MHVTVTTADTTGETIGNAAIVAEEMESWLREMEGFEGLLLLASEGRALGLAFWASREIAEHHAVARAEFRERMLGVAGVRIEEVVDYEVAFARFGPRLIEAAGRVAHVPAASRTASSLDPAPCRRNAIPSRFQRSAPGLTSNASRWIVPSAPTSVKVPRAAPSSQSPDMSPTVTSSAVPLTGTTAMPACTSVTRHCVRTIRPCS